jgi:hypothetical protein
MGIKSVYVDLWDELCVYLYLDVWNSRTPVRFALIISRKLSVKYIYLVIFLYVIELFALFHTLAGCNETI